MILSDVAVKRPVFASVLSLLLCAFGLVSFQLLPLREYPDIDVPVISVETRYRGASAVVVERRITKPIEDRISGIEGIKNVLSESRDGRSSITIEFNVEQDIDNAANDVRDRVSRVLDDLPEEADPPEISKAGADDDTIMWFNLVSDRMSLLELTDYARRQLVDRFSALDGVARIRVGGGLDYAVRIWLDRNALAARELTVSDIEQALRTQNLELPAGSIESLERQFTVRVERLYQTPEAFRSLVLKETADGYLTRLGDVARVELGAAESRISFRGNGVPMVGIGITRQSTANTLDVARQARALREKIAPSLPNGMQLLPSYDSSVFIQQAISEVYQTLFIAISLVVIVIYLFLGNLRAMLIPALTVPVSLLGTFIILLWLGYTINLLSLLALILAIGVVVDDAIVVLENISRRIQHGEHPLLAAFRGARQVGFAVVATSLVLIAVFVPLTFLQGDLGVIFGEFAVTICAAVAFSSLVALTLSPMLCSKLLKKHKESRGLNRGVDYLVNRARELYERYLCWSIKRPQLVILLLAAILLSAGWLLIKLPSEFTPQEDRGAFFVIVSTPEGATYSYSRAYMDELERRLMPLVDNGEVTRLLVRTPRAWQATSDFSGGFVILVLSDWAERRSAWEIIGDVQSRIGDLPGVRAFPLMRQGLGRGFSKPVQFVIGGPDYQTLAQWRDLMLQGAAQNEVLSNGLAGLDHDYKETRPQLRVRIDADRAGDLGISVQSIGRTLETMLGSRVITTFEQAGEEYDVVLEGERATQRTPLALSQIRVRTGAGDQLVPLSSLLSVEEFGDASVLRRYNRMRAVTLEANLTPGFTLGQALDELDRLAAQQLPLDATVSYKGQSQDLRETSQEIYFVFVLALLVVYLVLAAQFESYIHPLVILFTVPLAMCGALLGLYLADFSLNLYSQIGLIMLIGLAAKNGILIVEFANQLRDKGEAFEEALIHAASLRLRPIMMTGFTTALGSLPLVLATGAGSETRQVVGMVILSGVILATVFTVLVVPVMYSLLARHTDSPDAVSRQLSKQLEQQKNRESS